MEDVGTIWKRQGRGRGCGKPSTHFHPGFLALLLSFAIVRILPPARFLGLPELEVADMTEVPEWLLVRTGLPKVVEMAEDTRVPLRFFKKGICDRRTDGENGFLEEDEDTGQEKKREARVVKDARIPFRYFRNLHLPLDILEACSGDKDETQRIEALSEESDLVLQDVKETSFACQMGNLEKDVCTRELLMKQINDCGRVDGGVLRTM